jgi:hypothetical protein
VIFSVWDDTRFFIIRQMRVHGSEPSSMEEGQCFADSGLVFVGLWWDGLQDPEPGMFIFHDYPGQGALRAARDIDIRTGFSEF